MVWECQLKKTIDATLGELFPQLSNELGKPLTPGWDAGAVGKPPEPTPEGGMKAP